MSNFNSRGFPYHRGRRLRSSANLRDIVSQVKLSLDDLVMPYFIKEIEDNSEVILLPMQFFLAWTMNNQNDFQSYTLYESDYPDMEEK